MSTTAPVRLGLRENLPQFALLVLVNAFVGAMVGIERSILPALAEQEFHLAARAGVLSFIVVFGVTKALTNYVAGRLSDAVGRQVVLVAGWFVAVPVPYLLIFASSWTGVLIANVLLGVSQGLTWSTTVIMKIDLVGPARRGLAMGLNEFAGYFAVALSALATGVLASRYGLRPEPFYLGIGFSMAGLVLSALAVRETRHFVRHEAALAGAATGPVPTAREVFVRTTYRDRDLGAVTQAGLVNNLNDGMAWGLFPVAFAAAGLSLERIGVLAAIYPAVWGIGQAFTGALSDRLGRKWLIAGGMWTQAAGIALVAAGRGFPAFATGAVLLGAGTALVYPTLLAAIGDVAHPSWRASAVGVYRLWRDLGYAIGAVIAGVVADQFGVPAAIAVVAAITAASGVFTAVRMRETRRVAAPAPPECVPAAEVRTLLAQEAPVMLIDVRSPEEYEAAHVPGAVNIPLPHLAERARELPKDRPVVTVCGKGGGRSNEAAALLRREGFGARSLCGGTFGWSGPAADDGRQGACGVT